MEDIIKLRSRYGAINYLKKMTKPDGVDSKTYVLKTDVPTLRVGKVQGGNKFIDPSGGPMIVVGHELEEACIKLLPQRGRQIQDTCAGIED